MSRFVVVLLSCVTIFLSFFPFSEAQAHAHNDEWRAFANMGQVAVPLGALGLIFVLQDEEGLKQFGASYLSAGLAVQALKYTVREKRPRGDNRDSFPSGHTASAFSGSWFIWHRYGWQAGMVAMPMAALVGYSRVRTRNHYTQDVLASIALTGVVSYLLTTPYTNPQAKKQPQEPSRFNFICAPEEKGGLWAQASYTIPF